MARANAIVAACEDALKAVTREKKDPEQTARWHYEIARQSEYPIGDLTRAIEEYQRAVALRPDHLPSIRGARRVLMRQGSLSQCLQWFDAEVRLAATPKQRADLLLEKAECLSRLNRDTEVPKVLATASEVLPADIRVASVAVLAERRAGNATSLDRALAQAIEASSADSKLRAVLLAERARLAETTRKDNKAAIELYRAALTADVHAAGVVSALERLYYVEARYNELAEVTALAAQQAPTGQGRALALQRLSQIFLDHLGRVNEGLSAIERAHADLPADVAILEDLIRAYERHGKDAKLAAALEQLYLLHADAKSRSGIAYRIGKIYEQELKDEAQAASWYSKELERSPSDTAALDALGGLYAKHAQWKQLVQMRLAEAEACQEGPRRAYALHAVARIVETKLKDANEACRIHARALAADSNYVPAFMALERLLGAAGRHAELVKLYEQAIDGCEDIDARNALLFKAGRIQEDVLGNARAAYGVYERISGQGHGHAQLESLHAMQRAAERGQLWAELAHALEQEAALTQETPRKLALLHRAAEVYAEDLAEIDGASTRYKKVLEIETKYEPSLCGYASLLARAGHWDEWLGVQKRYLAAVPAGVVRAALQYDLGRVLEEHLGKRSEAIAAYRDALSSNPHHLLAQLALERLLSLEERWPELMEIYEKSSTSGDSAVAARRLCRAAEILEHRMGKPEQALALFEKVLTLEPDSARAQSGRLRLLCLARSSKPLAEAYAAQAQAVPNTPDARLALFREAEVRRDELTQADKAVVAFESVVASDAKHLASWVALEELQSAQGNWQAIPGILSAIVPLLSDPNARVAALLRHADVLRRLGNSEQQLAVLVHLLEVDPNNVQALEQLEQLALESTNVSLLGQVDARLAALVEDPRRAAAHQTRLAEALEDATDAAALDNYLAAYERDREDVAAVRGIGRLATMRRDISRIELAAEGELVATRDLDVAAGLMLYSSTLRQSVGDLEGAVLVAAMSLAVNPDSDDALERLTDLRLQQQQVDLLVEELANAAGQAKSKDRSATLWIRIAHVLADIKGDVAGAIGALSRVTQSQPNNVEAWLEIGDLYVRDGQLQAAVERYKKVLDAHATPEQLLQARLAIGTLFVELNQPSQAMEHLQAVLSISPGEPKALRALLEVRLQRGETEVAANLANQLIQHAPSIEDQAEALVSLGRIERKRRRPQEAVLALAQAVAQVGVEGRAATELMNLLGTLRSEGQKADFAVAANALTHFLEQRSQPGLGQVKALALLARIYDRELNQPDNGVVHLERAIQQAPDDAELQALLAAMLERAGRFAVAIDAYRGQLRFDAGRADCYRGISRCLEQLNRGPDALIALVPLAVLNAATEAEAATLATRNQGPAQLVPRGLSLDLLDTLGSPTVADPVGNLIATMADGLDRTEAVEVERFGLSSRDRLNARSGHPLRAVAERVASATGIEEFEIYVAAQGVNTLLVTTTEPPGIIVPVRLLEMPEPVQIFAFARIFSLMSRRWHACDQFDAMTLQQWYMAALRLADSDYAVGTAHDDLVTSLSKRLAKALSWGPALPWGRRGRVEEAAQACFGVNIAAVDEFRLHARWAAARLALVLCDDLSGCVNWVRQTEGDPSARPSSPPGVAATQLADELMRAWVSDGASEVRRRLGMG
ncbi:MAG TPA: tetratricopeptide repeat protein [Polyangiaceae bacterium]|nr:tetratricopeptide repeat protein [Polyangiaceae bacterium]